jgi:hypothetical protein
VDAASERGAMKQKRIWVVLVTAVVVFLVGFAIQHYVPPPTHPHHESRWWLAYYGCWLVFAGWMFMQPPAPSKGIAPIPLADLGASCMPSRLGASYAGWLERLEIDSAASVLGAAFFISILYWWFHSLRGPKAVAPASSFLTSLGTDKSPSCRKGPEVHSFKHSNGFAWRYRVPTRGPRG